MVEINPLGPKLFKTAKGHSKMLGGARPQHARIGRQKTQRCEMRVERVAQIESQAKPVNAAVSP